MQSYCAPHMGLCLNYKRHPYSEIYLGVMVVMMIVLGIPTCIGIIEFILNFKFCQRYDEEKDAMLGGMTICECFTYMLTCGKSMDVPPQDKDEYIYKYQVADDVGDGVKEAHDEHHNVVDDIEKPPAPKTFNDLQKNQAVNEQADEAAEDVRLIEENEDLNLPKPKRRNCCTRLICLICCCDTNEIGSQSHLNNLNEYEIQQLVQEIAKREREKKMEVQGDPNLLQIPSDAKQNQEIGSDLLPHPETKSQKSS
mmetsp:Transcript_2214/g.3835  ORF Transcript_2214/g.3835 Transcript_2214/m.3835 type:complete len:253 (+) Transcript_2214:561-1319(+)